MWLRASIIPSESETCEDGIVWERNCVDVLTGALIECHKPGTFSHGFKGQGENSLEYILDLSASVHDGDPPWDEHVMKYPPPETVKPFDLAPVTDNGKEGKNEVYVTQDKTRNWRFDDWNMARDTVKLSCNDGKGNSPDNGILESDWFHIWTGAGWRDRGASPYEKNEWCQYVYPCEYISKYQ